MNAFTFLTENGKFNNSEIMKHAHILKAYRRISLSEALKQAWFLAKRQQREYREIEEEKKSYIIRKSKFPQNPKRSVRFSGKRTKRSVQKRKARNTQKAETKVL